jgi:hypothetical protein
MSLQIAGLDVEGTVFGEDEAGILGMRARDIGSDLGQIDQCSRLRIRNLAFEVVFVAAGENVMLLFHR